MNPFRRITARVCIIARILSPRGGGFGSRLACTIPPCSATPRPLFYDSYPRRCSSEGDTYILDYSSSQRIFVRYTPRITPRAPRNNPHLSRNEKKPFVMGAGNI